MKEEKCEICATETKYVIHADFSKDGVKLDGTTILCDACYNEVD